MIVLSLVFEGWKEWPRKLEYAFGWQTSTATMHTYFRNTLNLSINKYMKRKLHDDVFVCVCMCIANLNLVKFIRQTHARLFEQQWKPDQHLLVILRIFSSSRLNPLFMLHTLNHSKVFFWLHYYRSIMSFCSVFNFFCFSFLIKYTHETSSQIERVFFSLCAFLFLSKTNLDENWLIEKAVAIWIHIDFHAKFYAKQNKMYFVTK